jgi:hypothetical protein
MTWVIEFSYPYEGENNVTAWDSEASALQQACAEVMTHIEDYWDMSETDYATAAKTINDLVKAGHFSKAVDFWNNCHLNCDAQCATFWYVRHLPQNNYPYILPTWDDSFFTALLPQDEAVCADHDGEYQATSDGATCRTCHQHNEYARADQRDGTYVCRGCKMMSQVFGAEDE